MRRHTIIIIMQYDGGAGEGGDRQIVRSRRVVVVEKQNPLPLFNH
jgi:hypothetical protein